MPMEPHSPRPDGVGRPVRLRVHAGLPHRVPRSRGAAASAGGAAVVVAPGPPVARTAAELRAEARDVLRRTERATRGLGHGSWRAVADLEDLVVALDDLQDRIRACDGRGPEAVVDLRVARASIRAALVIVVRAIEVLRA